MRCPLFTAAFMAAVSVFSATATSAEMQLAQVEVVESSPLIRAIGQQRDNAASTNSDSSSQGVDNLQSELYYQLQILQEEVQGLRGLVEEQSYQIQQLKQQRMDDYVDLDRRISELSQNGGGNTSGRESRSSASDGSMSTGNGSGPLRDSERDAPAGEFDSYSAAVDLATKRQDFDAAIAALNQHLEEYPDGNYAPNAHYWLGQIHFVQGGMEEAQQAFARVVDDYADHNKAPEARYKLGQVYFRLGDKEKAKNLLDQVANGNSDSAPLAKNFLDQNY